ncbi:MAG: PilT/PilU family type 4a pilus ATPase [Myxococcaceae bacterium]|nr:PilT/PilU family type 4a pilus ATPase [Myxococcaceae bacterium]MCA3012529.1 PilT/PilU family type 4a pilus ATPase [Myxococcaceae bacterium]
MAFGLFGNKETPLEKLASGKVKNDQEKQALLQALGSPSAEEVIPLVLLDDATIASRGFQLFVQKATPPALAALLDEGLTRNQVTTLAKVFQKCRDDMVAPTIGAALARTKSEHARKLWELSLDLQAAVSDPLLERAMKEAPGPQRVIALRRLIKAKGVPALKATLVEAVESREVALRKEAMTHLSTLEGDDVFAAMLERLGSDDSKEVREAAGAWLQRYIAKAPPDVRPRVLGKLLLAGTPEQRTQLVKNMFSQGNPGDLLMGVLLFCKTLTGVQHRTVMGALQSVGKSLIPHAVTILSNSDADLRVQAVYLLEAYEDPATIGPMLQMLNDPDWWVRIVACETMGRLKEPKTVPALQRMLSDADAKWAAIDAVASIGGPEATAVLVALLKDPMAEVRAATVRALGRLKDLKLEPTLTEVAKNDQAVDVRLKAVEVLRDLKGGGSGSGAVVSSKDLTKPIEKLLAFAREKGASDLHLTPGEPPLIRLNGALVRLESQKMDSEQVRQMLVDLLDPVRAPLLEKHGSVDFCYPIAGVGRYRANVYKMKRGYAGAFRCIPNVAPTIKQLGLPKKLNDIGTLHQGIVLVTGPTGCGKTTTLTALVDLVNETRQAHVLTFEDPVEFVHTPKMALINQREIGKDSMTYAAAMRGALREDPDIIVVGDMRDPDTIRLALLASETGHLVVATMQTTGAVATIDKLVESFPSDEQQQVRVGLSESLKLVISQVLVPHANGASRVGIFEVLASTSSVRALIRDGRTLQLPSAMLIGRSQGMQTIDGSLEERLRAGDITFETAMLYAQNKESFSKLSALQGAGGSALGAAPASQPQAPAGPTAQAQRPVANPAMQPRPGMPMAARPVAPGAPAGPGAPAAAAAPPKERPS